MSESSAVIDPALEAARLREQAARIRTSELLRRSDTLQRLFDYLVECAISDHSPKESEIADKVFGRGNDPDILLDGSVRVNVHRLRKKLEEFYADAAEGEERLALPKGGYRLLLVPREKRAKVDDGVVATGEPVSRRLGRPRLALAGLLILAVAGWGVAAWQIAQVPPAARAATAEPWSRLATSGRQTLIVVGDYYIFGESSGDEAPDRLVREFAVNSPHDLDAYLKNHPQDADRYHDVGLSYLPIGAATALGALTSVIEAAGGHGGAGSVRVIPMSAVTPELLKNANIIYVGLLSGLGPLRRPVFGASRLRVGSSYDELIDTVGGRRYVADAPTSEGTRAGRIDYAYVAAFRAPAGNDMIIVAGTRDAALAQAAEIAASPAALAKVARRNGAPASFEALYEVAALENVNVSNRLLFAVPRGDVPLPGRGSISAFPDDISSAPAEQNGF